MSSDPSFLRKPAPARRRVGEWIALVVLGLLLAVQLFLAQRTQLAGDARWRPRVQAICDVAGCSVPAYCKARTTRLNADLSSKGR